MKNKYIQFTEKMKAEVVEGEINLKPDCVIIKTETTLISTGTELTNFEGTHTSFLTGRSKYPCENIGYSNVGIIHEIGKDVKDLKVGEKVFNLGYHGDYCLVWDKNTTRIPGDLDNESATFAAVGAVALHGIRDAQIEPGETVLVLGQGLIGQLVLQLLRLSGAKCVIAADALNSRLKVSGESADHLINAAKTPVEEEIARLTEKKGCNAVIDTTGSTKAVKSALASAGNKGRVVILGCPHGEVKIDNFYAEVQKKELTIKGSYPPNGPQITTSYYPWSQQANRRIILEYLKDKRLNALKLVTHRGHYTEAQKLFTILSKEKDKAIAAILNWD